jgi:hypothetical protein
MYIFFYIKFFFFLGITLFSSYVYFQCGASYVVFSNPRCIFYQVFLVTLALVMDYHVALWYLVVFGGRYPFSCFLYSGPVWQLFLHTLFFFFSGSKK